MIEAIVRVGIVLLTIALIVLAALILGDRRR